MVTWTLLPTLLPLTMSPPRFPLVAEIHQRITAKYSPEREHEAREWIELVVGEPFPHEGFQESLKDGMILCKRVTRPYYNQHRRCCRLSVRRQ